MSPFWPSRRPGAVVGARHRLTAPGPCPRGGQSACYYMGWDRSYSSGLRWEELRTPPETQLGLDDLHRAALSIVQLGVERRRRSEVGPRFIGEGARRLRHAAVAAEVGIEDEAW